MFDIGWTELALIALVAIIVIGPKDLPKAMKTVAGWVARVRGLAREFQSGIDEMVREAELEEVRAEMNKLATSDVNAVVENTIDPGGAVQKELDLEGGFAPPDEAPPIEAASIEAPKAEAPKPDGQKTEAKPAAASDTKGGGETKPATAETASTAKPKASGGKGKTAGGGKRPPGSGASKSKAQA